MNQEKSRKNYNEKYEDLIHSITKYHEKMNIETVGLFIVLIGCFGIPGNFRDLRGFSVVVCLLIWLNNLYYYARQNFESDKSLPQQLKLLKIEIQNDLGFLERDDLIKKIDEQIKNFSIFSMLIKHRVFVVTCIAIGWAIYKHWIWMT